MLVMGWDSSILEVIDTVLIYSIIVLSLCKRKIILLYMHYFLEIGISSA
tara:strand:+ start:293 stop:439 length:147 start_codon:yes stop_codon:yes gene_type:complete